MKHRSVVIACVIGLVPTAGFSEVGNCMRLDNAVSPTQYRSAWGQFLSTQFEVSQQALGQVRLQFRDGTINVVLLFTADEAQHVAEAVGAMTDVGADGIHRVELSFEALFQMGPKWYRTGTSRGRAVVEHGRGASETTPYLFSFKRFVDQDSPFMSYEAQPLHMSSDMLAHVAELFRGETDIVASLNELAPCGFADLHPGPGY